MKHFLLYAELEPIVTDTEKVKLLQTHHTNSVKTLIASQASLQARQNNREANLHLELQDADVQISTNHLNKRVEELTQNAFKFSSAGTLVTATSTRSNNTFTLAVSDKGRGMTPEQIAQVGAYRQFQRKLYEHQGSGLGLAIAKRLSELNVSTMFAFKRI